VSIQVGGKKLRAIAEPLSPERSAEEMVRYAQHHRRAALQLAGLIGLELENPDNIDEWRTVGRDYIPFVALHVQKSAE
jgi:hypothetical protein